MNKANRIVPIIKLAIAVILPTSDMLYMIFCVRD